MCLELGSSLGEERLYELFSSHDLSECLTETTEGGKDLFWLLVLEGLVHDGLLWYAWTEYHSGWLEGVVEDPLHLTVNGM